MLSGNGYEKKESVFFKALIKINLRDLFRL